jgi:SAM-dependent methyltransferase
MHDSALDKLSTFRRAYLSAFEDAPLTVLDVGSAIADPTHDCNRTIMQNARWTLQGLDIEAAPNVDIIVNEPYDWKEVPAASIDVVTCSQVFEHAEYFWITMLEIGRVLKTNGLAFINAPGSGPLHRYPVDCWRFYDDAFPALAKYASLDLIESQVQWAPAYRKSLKWRDATAIMQRPKRDAALERQVALRTAGAKLSAKAVPDVADLHVEALPEPRASVIAPVTSQGCLKARELALLADVHPVRHRAYLIRRELRSIAQIVSHRLGDLRL